MLVVQAPMVYAAGMRSPRSPNTVTTGRPSGRGLKPKLLLLAAAALFAGTVHGLLAPGADPLDDFPHTFLAQPGYDPDAVTVIRTPLSQPPPAPPGMAPAWSCDAPAFADAQGRPWLFPLIVTGEGRPSPPTHPGLGMAPPLESCKPLRTAEGERLLEAFRAAAGR